MKLSEMKQLLAERDLQLTKSLGQNFLHDRNQLEKIIAAAELIKSDKVLEIGPGLGPLTEQLIARAGEVLAIEKDNRLTEILEKRFGSTIKLVHDDGLEYLRQKRRDWTEWKLVSNLPYSVASPILVELALAERGPERMVATLQLEVARRIAAGPRDPDYGVLTLLVQLNYAPQGLFKIPAGCFFPEPDVDSACVTLARRSERRLPPELTDAFCRIVKRSFSQRRKMMFKLLKEEWPEEKLQPAFKQLNLSPQVRAEAVGIDQFVALTGLLCQS